MRTRSGDFSVKTYLAKGKRGVVSTVRWRGKPAVVKERNPSAKTDSLAREAMMLRKANEVGVGPKLYAVEPGRVVMELIVGTPVETWIASADRANILKVLLRVLDQCRALDAAGITKHEMTHPHKHIIIRRGKPVQIDFERAIFTARPKNVTQACQWMTGGTLTPLLARKHLDLPRAALVTAAKAYKETYAEREYHALRAIVENA